MHTSSRILTFVVLFLAVPLAGRTQAPQVVGYQGYLTDADGEPVESTDATLTFRLWEEAAPGGTAVWTETQTGLTLTEGVFSVELGEVEGLDAVAFDRPLWLSTAVGDAGAEELLPRTALTAVPYSLRARTLDLPIELEVDAGGDTAFSLRNSGTNATAYFHADNITANAPTVATVSSTLGPAFMATAFGLGGAGLFRIDNNGNAKPALEAVTTSNSGSVALLAHHDGSDPDADIAVFQSDGATEARIDKQGVGHFGSLVAEDEMSGTPEPGGVYRDNVVYAWARVNADGSLSDGFGCTAVRIGTGRYRVTYDRSLSDGQAPVVSPLSANDPIIATVSPSGTNAANVVVFAFVNGQFLNTDRPFYIQVVGRP